MQAFKYIQGKTIEEQILSIDGILSSLGRRKEGIKKRTGVAIPCSLFLTDSDTAFTFITVAGTLSNIGIDIEECEKDVELLLTLTCGTKSTTEMVKVKKGLTKIEKTLSIEAYTKVKVSFTLPVKNAVIGFTFKMERGANETTIISTE